MFFERLSIDSTHVRPPGNTVVNQDQRTHGRVPIKKVRRDRENPSLERSFRNGRRKSMVIVLSRSRAKCLPPLQVHQNRPQAP